MRLLRTRTLAVMVPFAGLVSGCNGPPLPDLTGTRVIVFCVVNCPILTETYANGSRIGDKAVTPEQLRAAAEGGDAIKSLR